MLSETGFSRRTFDDILNDKIERAKEMFGEDIDTSELTPLGKFFRINAYDQSLVEELAELIYYAIFPNTASGVSLDRLCVFVGIRRNSATKSQYKVSVTGTAGGTVPQGFLVGTETEINFENLQDTVIDDNGKATITVECVESGIIGNVPYSSITEIVNPSADVESIVGIEVIEKGEETESDYELRNRFNEAKEGLGSCTEISIKSALLRIPSVTSASVVVNETNETVDGRPPHSFECFVSGGTEYLTEIANTIFEKKPIGIKTYGTIAQQITDSGGHTHTINFSQTTDITVYVRVAINTDTTFETSGKTQIKENLTAYIDSIGVGNTLYLSSLYGKIHGVTGVKEVALLELSTDGESWQTTNIQAELYENCVCYQVSVKKDSGDYEVIE